MDLATLALKVDHSSVDSASKSLDGLKDASQKQEQVTRGLAAALGSVTTGFLGASAVMGTTTAIMYDMYRHTDLMRDKAQEMASALTASSVSAQALADRLRPDLAIMNDLIDAGAKGAHALDRMDVVKAKLYALGPDYRKMIDDEVIGYRDLLGVIEKINAATMKRVELQIQDEQRQVKKATSPGWMQNLGNALYAGGLTGLGGYLGSRGLDADQLKLEEENRKLNKLFDDRAKLMDKSEFKAPKGGASSGMEGLFTDRRPYRDFVAEKFSPIHERTIQDFQIATTAGLEFDWMIKGLNRDLENFQRVQGWADPVTAGMEQIKRDRAFLDANEGLLGAESYQKGMEVLNRDLLKLRAANGDTWAIMGQTVVANSGMAADALTRWSSNVDGLGVSWHTLGDTVRNVLADMIRQMERAVIQQKLLDPLISVGLKAFTGSFNDTKYGTGTGNYSDSGYDANFGMANRGASFEAMASSRGGGASVQTSIVVQVGDGGAKADTKGGGDIGVEIGRVVEGAINQWANRESRVGGRLAR